MTILFIRNEHEYLLSKLFNDSNDPIIQWIFYWNPNENNSIACNYDQRSRWYQPSHTHRRTNSLGSIQIAYPMSELKYNCKHAFNVIVSLMSYVSYRQGCSLLLCIYSLQGFPVSQCVCHNLVQATTRNKIKKIRPNLESFANFHVFLKWLSIFCHNTNKKIWTRHQILIGIWNMTMKSNTFIKLTTQ